MSNQVPEVTKSEQERIICRLLEMGYGLEEVNAEVNRQAETGAKYTLDSISWALSVRGAF